MESTISEVNVIGCSFYACYGSFGSALYVTVEPKGGDFTKPPQFNIIDSKFVDGRSPGKIVFSYYLSFC